MDRINKWKVAESFGRLLHDKRVSYGFTQKQIAEFCGCDNSLISYLENGKNTPFIPLLWYLINVVTTDDLREWYRNETPD